MTKPTTGHAEIQRTTLATDWTFPALVCAFEHELPRLDPAVGKTLVARQAPWNEVEREIERIAEHHLAVAVDCGRRKVRES